MEEHHLSNGIHIVGEKQQGVQSAAGSFIFPFGAAYDPKGKEGLSLLTTELFVKGCEGLDARALSSKFEELGIHKSVDCGVESTNAACVCLGENLPEALKLMGKMTMKPAFPAEEIESARSLLLQDLLSLEDEPASKAQIELFKLFYSAPFNVSHYGTKDGLMSCSVEDVRSFHKETFCSGAPVIAVSGNFDWPEVVKAVEEAFSEFSFERERLPMSAPSSQAQYTHLQQDTAQVQIAMAYPSVDARDSEVIKAKVANGVLSGGMCGRLFVEVREKRGLVYRVGSTHSEASGRGAVFAFAGTTAERAQETFDVMLEQIKSVSEGVSDEELHRSKVDLRSSLIIRGESTSARAASMARDYWNTANVRTLEEIDKSIQAVTGSEVVSFAKAHPPAPLSVLTLGSKGIEVK